ncbi:MAG: hypothetical protein IPM50_12245 [Acidobacteriota bacterium]|nr:MAG: hypothetical protein IPM50_12245 [Acidobacteriota bacterium]
MRILALTILLLAAAVIVPAQLMSEHNIAAGTSAYVKGARLTIKFVEVVEDSRCPRDVNCIWEGNAKVKLLVSKGRKRSQEVELNSGVEPTTVSVFGYDLSLKDLTPYPDTSNPSSDMPKALISVKAAKK